MLTQLKGTLLSFYDKTKSSQRNCLRSLIVCFAKLQIWQSAFIQNCIIKKLCVISLTTNGLILCCLCISKSEYRKNFAFLLNKCCIMQMIMQMIILRKFKRKSQKMHLCHHYIEDMVMISSDENKRNYRNTLVHYNDDQMNAQPLYMDYHDMNLRPVIIKQKRVK